MNFMVYEQGDSLVFYHFRIFERFLIMQMKCLLIGYFCCALIIV